MAVYTKSISININRAKLSENRRMSRQIGDKLISVYTKSEGINFNFSKLKIQGRICNKLTIEVNSHTDPFKSPGFP